MQTTTTTTTPARINVEPLTAILDAANQAWRDVLAADDPADQRRHLRAHVRQITGYLNELDKSLNIADSERTKR